MNNYSPPLPTDAGGEKKQFYPPAKVAVASSNKENAQVSSILYLTHNTTELEVAAIGQSAAIKWMAQATIDSSVAGTSVITAAGSANYDAVIPVSTQRRFVVPISTNVAGYSSAMGVNRREGLFPAVALKTLAGTGSVLIAEY